MTQVCHQIVIWSISRKLLLVHPCITQLELRHLLTQRFPAFCYRFDFHYQLFSFFTKSTCYRFPLTKLTWVLDFHHRLLSFLTKLTWNLILSFEYNTLSAGVKCRWQIARWKYRERKDYIWLMNWKWIRILVNSTCEGGRPLALGRTTRTLNTGKPSCNRLESHFDCCWVVDAFFCSIGRFWCFSSSSGNWL